MTSFTKNQFLNTLKEALEQFCFKDGRETYANRGLMYEQAMRLIDEMLQEDEEQWNVNHHSTKSLPLLCYAIIVQRSDFVEWLLTQGANPNLGPSEFPPITYAIQFLNANDFTIIDLLLKYGADINTKDYFGFSPLDTALRHPTKGIAVELIHRGAQITKTTEYLLKQCSEEMKASVENAILQKTTIFKNRTSNKTRL